MKKLSYLFLISLFVMSGKLYSRPVNARNLNGKLKTVDVSEHPTNKELLNALLDAFDLDQSSGQVVIKGRLLPNNDELVSETHNLTPTRFKNELPQLRY